MSLVSVYTNLDIVKKYIDEINNVNNVIGDLHENQLAGYVISECAVRQYEMKRNYLNINMLNKRHLSTNLSKCELLDTLYQHIYMHNHIALCDELYEVSDANDKYMNLNMNCTEEKILMTRLLILEEWIDAYHFITEMTSTLKEHFLLTLEDNKINSTEKVLQYYFTGENDFSDNVKFLVSAEGYHISEAIKDYTPKIRPLYINERVLYSPEFIKESKKCIKYLHKLNRELIREVNFKDWKQYPGDYFNAVKFAKLSNINRDMYYYCLKGISFNIDKLCSILDYKIDLKSSDDVYKILYAVYNQKRKLNIDRQLNDPRYKLNNIGDIIGDKV